MCYKALTPYPLQWWHFFDDCLLSSLLSGSPGKEFTCSEGDTGDVGSIPGLGQSLGEGHGKTFWYSCLENLKEQRSLRATVHGVTKSWTLLSLFTQVLIIWFWWGLLISFYPSNFPDSMEPLDLK